MTSLSTPARLAAMRRCATILEHDLTMLVEATMLERHEIEVLLTLAEELHFGRTADRLHISTARVSQTVAKIERRLGVPLFDRSSRRVAATPAGLELCAELRPAWDRISAAVQRTVETGRGRGGTLEVAFVEAATGQLLTRAAEIFRERLPDCAVRIREVRPAQVIPWLRDGEIDIALGTLPVPDPDIAAGPVLVTEAQVLALPVNHLLAQRRSVALTDIPAAALLTGSGTTAEALTSVGAGKGVLPIGAHAQRYHARPDVAYVPLRDAPPIRWALLWRKGNDTARNRGFRDAAEIAARP